MLKGELLFVIDGQEYRLGPGDSIHLRANVRAPHPQRRRRADRRRLRAHAEAVLTAAMSLLRYSLRRLLLLVPTLFGVTVVAFVLLRVLPGDPIATILGQTAGEEEIAAARARFGLDKPIIVQFWDYLTNLVTGDLGTSIQSGRPVREEILDRIGPTLELVILGVGIAVVCRPGVRGVVGDARQPPDRPRHPDHVAGRQLRARLLARPVADPRVLRLARLGAGAERAGRRRRRPRADHRLGDRRLDHHRQRRRVAFRARPPRPAR